MSLRATIDRGGFERKTILYLVVYKNVKDKTLRLRFRLSPPLVATILINYIIDNRYFIGEVIKG